MLAGPGNGKTHIIDTVCRAKHTQFLKQYCIPFQHKLNLVNESILDLTQKREIMSEGEYERESRGLEDLKWDLESKISDIEAVERILKEKIFFVPISFSILDDITQEEQKLSPTALLVCRMLYFYFVCFKVAGVGGSKEKLSIESFLKEFYPIITSISASQALEAIRKDQEAPDSDSDPNFPPLEPDNRAFIVVDEISKLNEVGLKDYKKQFYQLVTRFLRGELATNCHE